MKSILRIYSWFLILLSLSYIGQAHTTQNDQQGWWHEPLVELYFKGTSKISRKETKDMIQVFEELHNRHIKSMQDIYNKIEPKMLNKSKFSSNKYELDVLTVFYLFKKIDSSKGLLQEEVQQGYQALTKLYYRVHGRSKKVKDLSRRYSRRQLLERIKNLPNMRAML